MRADGLVLNPYRTACWNVFVLTPVSNLVPVLRNSIDWGVTLWLMNEAQGADITDMLIDHGLRTENYDQWRIAWDPKRWGLDSQWHEKMSPTAWYAEGSDDPRYNWAQAVVLNDKESHADPTKRLSLEAWSYHTPADVQNSTPPARRYKSMLESYIFLADQAEDTEADGFIAGGDDNWDEDQGYQNEEATKVLLGLTSGLRQVQAGDPTFGKREIDDYRIRRLSAGGHVKPTGKVAVRSGGGTESPQHQIHLREWEWARIPLRAPAPTEHACPACGHQHSGVLTS